MCSRTINLGQRHRCALSSEQSRLLLPGVPILLGILHAACKSMPKSIVYERYSSLVLPRCPKNDIVEFNVPYVQAEMSQHRHSVREGVKNLESQLISESTGLLPELSMLLHQIRKSHPFHEFLKQEGVNETFRIRFAGPQAACAACH